MPLKVIPEVEQLSVLDTIAESYEREFGTPPFNLSHWDPSDLTVHSLLPHLILPNAPLAAPYLYPNDFPAKSEVVSRLGLAHTGCTFTPNGTSAIMFAVWWLKSRGVSRLIVLCPSYFPVFHACRMLDLPFLRIYMQRSSSKWLMPMDELFQAIDLPSKTAVWITNPVYCTGFYLDQEHADLIQALAGCGARVVLDECLVLPGKELGRQLHSEQLLGLYSPHKAVCLNSVKFGALIFSARFQRFFDDWSDVFIGGLNTANHIALMHFLGENFSHYQTKLLELLSPVRTQVRAEMRRRATHFDADLTTEGYFMTCYIPGIAAGVDKQFLQDLTFATGAMVIPGSRNHFGDAVGFNFRLNLARACPQFFAALNRTLIYLASKAA